ncbi:21951_t:CDS:2, partial [Racocetra persica]
EELVFCQRFRSQTGVKSEQIADNDILPYLSTGLTAERVANAYSFFNPQQRILVKEIINKQAIFAGRTYDLKTDNGLKKAQAAKLFLHDFHSQKGTKFEIDDKRILDYQEDEKFLTKFGLIMAKEKLMSERVDETTIERKK